MKVFTTVLFLTLIALPLFAQSPLVISSSNFKISTSSDTIGRADSPGFVSPAEGENKAWDYSNLMTYGALFDSASAPDYNIYPSGASIIRYNRYEELAFNRGFFYNEIYSLQENGYSSIGYLIPEQHYSIADLTMSPNDSIVLYKQLRLYNKPNSIISFPFTFGSVQKNNYERDFQFIVSVAMMGLDKDTAEKRTYIEQTDSVVGWGKLTLKGYSAESSVTFDVLLVKSRNIKTDSIFLRGLPADQTLLSAFQITQGNVEPQGYYSFYRENSKIPVMKIYYIDTSFTSVEGIEIDQSAIPITGISDEIIQQEQYTVYPNPSKDGYYTINLPETIEHGCYVNVSDLYGRSILTKAYEAGQLSLSFRLSEDAANGTYFYKVSDLTGHLKAYGKLLLSK